MILPPHSSSSSLTASRASCRSAGADGLALARVRARAAAACGTFRFVSLLPSFDCFSPLFSFTLVSQ